MMQLATPRSVTFSRPLQDFLFAELVGKTKICAEVAEVAPGVVAFPNGSATKIRGQECGCFPAKTR